MTSKVIRSPRLRTRRREVRRERLRRWTRRFVATLVLGGAITGGIAIARSPLFALEGVDVAGARTVSAERVRDAAALAPGENVLRLDLGAARRRVEALPQVRSAELRRSGALRVRITVVERTASLLVRSGASRRYFDRDGVEVMVPPKRAVPVVHLQTEMKPVGDGRMLEIAPIPEAELVRRVLRVWSASGALRGSVRRFDVDADGLRMTVGRTRVVVGGPESLPEKMAALRAIVAWAEERHTELRAIDVRVPDRPALRLA